MRHHPRSRTRARRSLGAAGLLLALTIAGCSSGDGEEVEVTPTASATSSAAQAPPEDAAGEDGPAEGAEPSSSETSQGGVVEGLPTDVIPVPDDAEVLLTSAIPDGDTIDVSLAARIDASPEDVLGVYREALTRAGFVESPSAGGPGATASTFTRGGGGEVVSVTVVPPSTPGDPHTFTVGGTVLAPAP